MRKITTAVICVLVAALVIIAGNAYIQKKNWSDGVAKLDPWSEIEGNEYNGGIADIVIGSKNAKVKIIEYADFQCSACAMTFPYIHDVVKEYGDDIAYIYRNYAIAYHKNATAAATAAYAANNQGYFEDFALVLFEKQDDWFYSEGEKRDKQFEDYFNQATGGNGDIEKYRADLKSQSIKDKIAVDRELAVRIKLNATPLIYINKEQFEITSAKEDDIKKDFRARIDAAIDAARAK